MTDTTWAALKDKKQQLLRKATDGSVFVAPIGSTAITALTAGSGSALQTLPSGYEDVGWTTDDGAQFARSVDGSNTTSWGSVEPTRSDITKDTTTLKFVAQETKLLTIGLYLGIDTSGLTADATTGELIVPRPSVPVNPYYRVLMLAVDEGDGGEIYIGRFLARARVTDYDDQPYKNDDNVIGYGVTMTGYEDSTLGFSEEQFFGGPGWKALLADMGLA
jgi:hypothetical protein